MSRNSGLRRCLSLRDVAMALAEPRPDMRVWRSGLTTSAAVCAILGEAEDVNSERARYGWTTRRAAAENAV